MLTCCQGFDQFIFTGNEPFIQKTLVKVVYFDASEGDNVIADVIVCCRL